jgi:hydroxymethylglutaryl-CoA reductase (NADPH)
MPTDYRRIHNYIERMLSAHSQPQLRQQLVPKPGNLPPKIPGGSQVDEATLAQRWRLLSGPQETRETLLDPQTLAQKEAYQHNIENFIGTVKVPVGLAGPLRVNGLFAQGDFYVPLATTEAALVASYSRGAQLISAAGGCTAMVLSESVSRAPGFAFADLIEAGRFVVWITSQMDEFKRQAAATTRYGQLVDLQIAIEGNHVYLNFEFLTGDAAGQNMVTIATQTICDYIKSNSPVQPHYFFVEANLSGDKKASAQSFLSVRGKKVSAEVLLPAGLVQERLHTTPQRMADYWRMSAVGGVLSGIMGMQGHYANGLAALYLACGQDVAGVAESAVGVTRFELTAAGDLYAAVTLPNLIVGTVGGGTGLPSQRACLEILGLAGPTKAQALAELCAALCLAGELSIAGAMCSGDFARAHQMLARSVK